MASLSSPLHLALSRTRRRFAHAIGVSVGVHVIVGAGVTVEHPDFAAPRAASPIYARLQHATSAPESRTASDPEISYPEAPAPETFRPQVNARAHRVAVAERSMRHTPERSVAEPEATRAQDRQLQQRSANERYYSAHELDIYPRLRQPLRGDFEIIAARTSPSLPLLIMVTLDETGNVEDLSVVERADAVMEKQLREALHRARFFPAEKDGHAVKSRLMMRID